MSSALPDLPLESPAADPPAAPSPAPAPLPADRSEEEGGVRVSSVVIGRAETDATPPSNAIDPFELLYQTFGELLVPPFKYERITELYNDSDVLQEAIDIVARNVTGFGYQFVLREAKLDPAQKEAADREKARLDRWWRYATVEAFTEHWKCLWIDFELYADAYQEVQRNKKGEVAGLTHVPAFTVRKAKRDPAPTLVQRWVLDPDGRWQKRPHWRRFRRYCQFVNGVTQWFKEFGDPRKIRADTGKVDASLADDAPELAHEMINFCNYAPDSPYGKPRWRGVTNALVGRSAAMGVNADYFDQKTIPPLLITVEGSTLSPRMHALIKDHFQQLRGRQNFHRVLVLEAVMQGGIADDRPTSVPKIGVHDLRLKTTNDGQFLTYMDKVATDVMCAFSLPPIFSGRTPGYNRATAEAQKVVAEEQAFAPARETIAETMNRLVQPELNAQFWDFKLKGAPLVNEEIVERMLKLGIEAGVLTPGQAAEVLEGVLGRELSRTEEWANVPVLVLREMLKRGLAPKGMAAVFESAGGTAPAGGFGEGGTGDGTPTEPDATDEAPEGDDGTPDEAGTEGEDGAQEEGGRVVEARRGTAPRTRRG